MTSFTARNIAILGYGISGQASARFLASQGANITVLDRQIPSCDFTCASLNNDSDLSAFDMLVVSPGISHDLACIAEYKANHGRVISDIDIFHHYNRVPVLAVTGSNGKTTVCHLLLHALTQAGYSVGMGGNSGTSVLDLLDQDYDYIVLELSSFQLAQTQDLTIYLAALLNFSADHLDRHGTLEAYREAKHRIFDFSEGLIVNQHDSESYPLKAEQIAKIVQVIGNENLYLSPKGVFAEQKCLISVEQSALIGGHNMLNMAFAAGFLLQLKLSKQQITDSLISFKGLAHRLALVARTDKLSWYNDSKATNPDACIQAVNALSCSTHKLVLIAGGDAKGVDLTDLLDFLAKHVDYLVLLGKDRDALVSAHIQTVMVNSMPEAVIAAYDWAQKQTLPSQVLLSPACSSTDMFENYAMRGRAFEQAVQQGLS